MGSGTTEVGTGGMKTRFIKEDWPNEEGKTAGTTKTHGRKFKLEASKKSLVPKKEKELL